LLIQPAYSLDKYEVQEKKAALERKELEQQHKATIDRIPNQTKKSDPGTACEATSLPKRKTIRTVARRRASPPGGYAGGKISYTRIPRAKSFW
jgi:hypothetical protein